MCCTHSECLPFVRLEIKFINLFLWWKTSVFTGQQYLCVSLTAPINYVRWQPNEKKMTTMKKNCLHALRHEHIHIKATNALLHCLLYWKMNEMWFCGQLTKESENTDNCVKALFYCTHTSALYRYKKYYMSKACAIRVDTEISKSVAAKNRQGVSTEAVTSHLGFLRHRRSFWIIIDVICPINNSEHRKLSQNR